MVVGCTVGALRGRKMHLPRQQRLLLCCVTSRYPLFSLSRSPRPFDSPDSPLTLLVSLRPLPRQPSGSTKKQRELIYNPRTLVKPIR